MVCIAKRGKDKQDGIDVDTTCACFEAVFGLLESLAGFLFDIRCLLPSLSLALFPDLPWAPALPSVVLPCQGPVLPWDSALPCWVWRSVRCRGVGGNLALQKQDICLDD